MKLPPLETLLGITTGRSFYKLPYHTGHLFAHCGLPSRFVNPRRLNVWLPPCYEKNSRHRYPVIYAQDGQNLFDPADAVGGIDWGIAPALAELAAAGEIRPAIVVGVWNTHARPQEYFPQRIFDTLMSTEEQRHCMQQYGRPNADLFLRYLVLELKPQIDAIFPTRPERDATLLMGSSMGGLISLYGLCEFPQVFGAAACLSTHWPACQGKMVDYLRDQLPVPGGHRFYFDYGTRTADRPYASYQRWVDAVLRQRGYRKERSGWLRRLLRLPSDRPHCNFTTLKFKGDEHSELAWSRRVAFPLRFLLGSPQH